MRSAHESSFFRNRIKHNSFQFLPTQSTYYNYVIGNKQSLLWIIIIIESKMLWSKSKLLEIYVFLHALSKYVIQNCSLKHKMPSLLFVFGYSKNASTNMQAAGCCLLVVCRWCFMCISILWCSLAKHSSNVNNFYIFFSM